MGRPVSTGKSHNKNSLTYRSKHGNKPTKPTGKQTTLTSLFKENVPKENTIDDDAGGPSNNNDTELTDTEVEQEASSVTTDIESDTESTHNTKEGINEFVKIDGRSYLAWHQSQQKWENLYPCYFYSASKQGWLCKICSENSTHGDEFWRSQAVKMGEHPGRLFSGHLNSDKHKNALKRQQESKQLLKKGSIYQRIHTGVHTQNLKIRQQNRTVIKKFLKTTYFVARKKWAVRELFGYYSFS